MDLSRDASGQCLRPLKQQACNLQYQPLPTCMRNPQLPLRAALPALCSDRRLRGWRRPSGGRALAAAIMTMMTRTGR